MAFNPYDLPFYSYSWMPTNTTTLPTVPRPTIDSNIDGPAASDLNSSPQFHAVPPQLQKPLPPTPSIEYGVTITPPKPSTPKLKPRGSSPLTGIMRNVRHVASWGFKAKGTGPEQNPKPRRAKRASARSPPQRIIYREKGTQTSFEYLPTTARMHLDMHSWQSKRRSSSGEEDMISANQTPLPTVEKSVAHSRYPKPRPSYRNFRSFLDNTSPSNPGTPTPSSIADNNTSLANSDPVAAQSRLAPKPKLNLDLVQSKPRRSAGSTKTIVRGSSSLDTTGTYDSYYSDPIPTTPQNEIGTGIAVTERGIIDRPVINRRAASDSTANDRKAKSPTHKREVSETSESGSLASTGITKKSETRSVPLVSPLRSRQRLSHGVSGQGLSPLRNMQLPSSNGDSKQSLNQHQRLTNLSPLVTPLPTAAQMNELDKPSPVIFRRPVEGYFAIRPVDVHEAPDHMQGSMLCPLHPNHRGGQEPWCNLHGGVDDSKYSVGSKSVQGEDSAANVGSHGKDSFNSVESSVRSNSSNVGDGNSQLLNDLDDLGPYHPLTGQRSPMRSPRSPHSPGPLGDLGASTAKATPVLIGNNGMPAYKDASRFELAGPNHQAGDKNCRARNGAGICVWHGRIR